MATVIPREKLSERIVKDLFRASLKEASGPESEDPEIVDPKEGERTSNQRFVHSSRPSRSPLYPILIVEEGADTASRPDRRVDLHEHQYDVLVTIQAASSTNLSRIKDQLRGWFENNIDMFNANGYEDPEIISAPRTDFNPDQAIEEKTFTFQGTVNTA